MKLFVTVKTNAREEQVKQEDETHFTVAVQALPIDGKANVAVRRALSRYLGIAPARLTLRSGAALRRKVFDCVDAE